MRLMGTPTLDDIKPYADFPRKSLPPASLTAVLYRNMVITRNLGDHFAPQPKDYLASRTYIPLPKL